MIKIGKYKNWPELCKDMGWEATSGRYKEKRKKELETLCKFHQEGNSWIIEEIYEDEIKEYYKKNQNKKEIHEILTVGMVIKNYKELCKLIGWEVRNGKSKKIQMSDLERFCSFHKEGNKIIIDEVYKEPVEKINKRINGNNTIYREKIQNLIIDMCSTNEVEKAEDERVIHMSMTKMMSRFNMINDNYLIGRNNMEELSKLKEIPIETLYDFYDSSFSNAKQNILRALDNLQNRFLINYKQNIMLILRDGRSRIANDLDIIFITQAESEVSEEMGVKNKRELFLQRRWNEFRTRVSNRLSNNTDIYGYYNVVTIYTGSKFRNMILDTEKKREMAKELNKSMAISVLNSAKRRHENSLSKNKHLDSSKYRNMRTDDYIGQTKELVDISIIESCCIDLMEELKNIEGKFTYKEKEEKYGLKGLEGKFSIYKNTHDTEQWEDMFRDNYDLLKEILEL